VNSRNNKLHEPIENHAHKYPITKKSLLQQVDINAQTTDRHALSGSETSIKKPTQQTTSHSNNFNGNFPPHQNFQTSVTDI
jgi:hypothetical protein